MFIGNLFDEYPVNIELDNKLTIFHGFNGSGKTKTLELLKDYFEKQGENVLYFSIDRYFNLTEDQLIACDTMYSILYEENLFKKFNLNINDLSVKYGYGELINSGMLQMMNFVCNILLADDNVIVLIDTPEINMDYHKKRDFVKSILKIDSIKQLFIVTHQPEILGNYRDSCIDIRKCVKLNIEEEGEDED